MVKGILTADVFMMLFQNYVLKAAVSQCSPVYLSQRTSIFGLVVLKDSHGPLVQQCDRFLVRCFSFLTSKCLFEKGLRGNHSLEQKRKDRADVAMETRRGESQK